MNKPLSIVVFGGTGFVGTHLCGRLVSLGHRVTIITRDVTQRSLTRALAGAKLVQADPYNVEAISHIMRDVQATAVVNLVGILNEDGRDGSGFHRAHVSITEGIMTAMRANGVKRLIQMSSLNAGKGESHYLKSRGEAESRVKASKMQWTIMQPSVIFGPNDSLFMRFANLLAIMPFMPLARAQAKMQPVFIGDVSQAIINALGDTNTIHQTYQLGGNEVYTLKQIVQIAGEYSGHPRMVLGLNDALGRLQAAIMGLVPGKPFSTDNFLSLKTDSVAEENGLAQLGIEPTPLHAVLPDMFDISRHQTKLDEYRAEF